MKFTTLSLVFVPMSILLCGCGTSHPHGANGIKPIRITVVTNNSSNWWVDARLGGEAAARELPNVSLDFRLLPEGTAGAQKTDVLDAIAAGADGIAVTPLDAVNQKQMIDQAASKVLVFTLDSDAPASNRACYVGTDDVQAGKMAGQLMAKALPTGGDIMVFVGKMDAQNAIDRLNGLKLGLKGSAIHIIDVRTDDADTTRAKANAADALVRYPNLAGMVGLWGYNGPAILSAVKDTNKSGKIKIVAFDEDIQTLEGIKNGQIFGTVVQQPYEFTEETVRRMVLYLRGDKNQIPENKKVIYPTKVIDKSNVDALLAKLSAHKK